MMQWLRRLFQGQSTDRASHLFVRCKRCGAPVHVRVDLYNDLNVEYGDDDSHNSFHLVKEVMDSRCFRLMRVEIHYDSNRRETERSIEGGSFITREEYDQLIARGEHERRS